MKPKSRSSSISSQHRPNRVTFRDIKAGNVSDDVLRAVTTAAPSQEKVYEDERVDSCCQTDELPTVDIRPVSFLSLPAEAIAQLRHELNATVEPAEGPARTVSEEEEELDPPSELTQSTLVGYEERSDISHLYETVSDQVKAIKGKVQFARGRKSLRDEQLEDEQHVRRKREVYVQSIIQQSEDGLNEAEVVHNNVVKVYQELCSEFRGMNWIEW